MLVSIYRYANSIERRGHYNRALEEAISTQKSQWPRSWHGQNPLPGSSTFNGLSPKDRVSVHHDMIAEGVLTIILAINDESPCPLVTTYI